MSTTPSTSKNTLASDVEIKGNLKFSGELRLCVNERSELNEGSDYIDADSCRSGRVEDGGRHDGSVLCKGGGQDRREFEFPEVVTICDHLGFLFFAKTKHKVGGEPVLVSFDGLVKCFGADSVKLGQISVQHDFQPTDQHD